MSSDCCGWTVVLLFLDCGGGGTLLLLPMQVSSVGSETLMRCARKKGNTCAYGQLQGETGKTNVYRAEYLR